MISALLLAHAGVPTEHIVADYTESVRAMAGGAPHGGPTVDRQAAWSDEEVEAWLAQAEPHVHAFVTDSGAMLDELHVADATRRRLRSLLVAADPPTTEGPLLR